MFTKHPRRFIIATLAAAFSCLAYGVFSQAAGWASSLSLSSTAGAARMVDAFEAASGRHPGFRRNHAKGTCLSGRFDSNGNGTEISTATFFRQGSYPFTGRFSVMGSNPSLNDTHGRLRSLAVAMTAGEEAWRMAMNSVPIFFVNTPEALLEQLRASVPDPETGAVDPARMDAFRKAHPEMQPFEQWLDTHRPSTGFDNAAYYSVNAFRFIDAAGRTQVARWRMEPEAVYAPLSTAQLEADDPDMLTYGLVSTLAEGPLRWHLILTLALPDDPVNDATQMWSNQGHREIDAGVLVIEHLHAQVDGACRDIDFDPLVLPQGIQPSADPLLRARSAAYAESHRRRVKEAGGY
jgi:catalase